MVMRRRSRPRGTVLVTVLMMFAVAALMATEMTYRQRLDIRRTGAMTQITQAREFLRAAEHASAAWLENEFAFKKGRPYPDLRHKQRTVPSRQLTVEALNAADLPLPGGIGNVFGVFRDAQGKFNVNNLVMAQQDDMGQSYKRNDAGRAALVSLLQALYPSIPGAEEVLPAQEWVDRVTDMMDSDQTPIGQYGEDDYSTTLTPSYRTPNMPMREVSEFFGIEGVNDEMMAVIAPYLTALPVGTPLNLNTALKEVLTAYQGQLKNGATTAQEILTTRAREPLESIDAFVKAEGGEGQVDPALPTDTGEAETPAVDPKTLFTVQSKYFDLESEVTLAGRTLYGRTLFHATVPEPGKSSANGVTLKAIYRAFVDPLQPALAPPTTLPGPAQ